MDKAKRYKKSSHNLMWDDKFQKYYIKQQLFAQISKNKNSIGKINSNKLKTLVKLF